MELFSSIFTALPSKLLKATKILEFMLDLLSQPLYSLIISWEGTNGQFKIKEPEQIANLWGERNGRTNMTYQKFSRSLRYYYNKNVLIKMPGRKRMYKFNFGELEKQYGFEGLSFPASSESTGSDNYFFPASGGFLYHPIPETNAFTLGELGVNSPRMPMTAPESGGRVPYPSYQNPHYFSPLSGCVFD